MNRNQKWISTLCAVLMLAVLLCCGRQQAFATETPAFVPTPEDFAGEYACSTISFGELVVPLEEEPYTLSIDGDKATIIGIKELGTDPLPLSFAEGELYFMPPEEDERVFTLRLQEDGLVTLRFDRIPEAPVFRFDPARPSLEDFEGEYIGKSISFGDTVIPLGEDEYNTLIIKGEEAVISEGIVTGTNGDGTMTVTLGYEDGELYWQPDGAETRVFTLRLLKDGSVTITFEINPEIPVFHFEPVETEE